MPLKLPHRHESAKDFEIKALQDEIKRLHDQLQHSKTHEF